MFATILLIQIERSDSFHPEEITVTAKRMSRLQVLVAIAFAVVALLAPLANAATVYVLDRGDAFGEFDLDGPAAFQYQLINADPGNGDLLNNLATDPTGGFYTFNYDDYQVGRISTAGNYTAIGPTGVELTGLSTDSSGTLYGYDLPGDAPHQFVSRPMTPAVASMSIGRVPCPEEVFH